MGKIEDMIVKNRKSKKEQKTVKPQKSKPRVKKTYKSKSKYAPPNKTQISIYLDNDLLSQMDKTGVSRPGLITMALRAYL
jgi:uncharacterized protein (DUF4415 family)